MQPHHCRGKSNRRKCPKHLLKKFPDFKRAYTENGLSLEEFDTFGSTRRTLRQFIAACAEMNSIVRDIMLPNPDIE